MKLRSTRIQGNLSRSKLVGKRMLHRRGVTVWRRAAGCVPCAPLATSVLTGQLDEYGSVRRTCHGCDIGRYATSSQSDTGAVHFCDDCETGRYMNVTGVSDVTQASASDDLMMNSPVLMSTHIYEQGGRFRVMPIQTRPLSRRQEHDDKYAEPPHRVLPQQEPVQVFCCHPAVNGRSSHRPMGQCWASTVARLQEARRHSQSLAELELPFSVVVTASVIHGLQPLSAFLRLQCFQCDFTCCMFLS